MLKQALLVSADGASLAYADEKIREEMQKDNPPIERRRGFDTLEVYKARLILMSGPRATPPTWRAVRKTILRMRNGSVIKGSWRSWSSKETVNV